MGAGPTRADICRTRISIFGADRTVVARRMSTFTCRADIRGAGIPVIGTLPRKERMGASGVPGALITCTLVIIIAIKSLARALTVYTMVVVCTQIAVEAWRPGQWFIQTSCLALAGILGTLQLVVTQPISVLETVAVIIQTIADFMRGNIGIANTQSGLCADSPSGAGTVVIFD